jgi:pyrimidine operon attenuation protein / uracil phosphoribosyltransferase
MNTALTLDAEALYAALLAGVRRMLAEQPDAVLVGIWSGGAWLAERLQADLGPSLVKGEAGVITSTLHRDDFANRGLAADGGTTRLPFEVDGARIVLIDDVLYTGRTIRAVVNELYDFGRPAGVSLAVLVDRGGRELPIEPAFAAARVALAPTQRLALAKDGSRFKFAVKEGD